MLLALHAALGDITVNRTADVPQDEADLEDKSILSQTPLEKTMASPTPHRRPPYLRLCNSNTNMPRQHFTHGPTLNSDHSRTYRILPIIAGVLIPLLVLLSIPSVTNHWYVRENWDNETVETSPMPLLLVAAMALSMTFGVLANTCLVLRFTERRVKTMTLLCIVFLSLNELINIPAVVTFAVIHRPNNGFIYGQSFWMTVCSIAVSAATNIILIIDYSHTKNFVKCGSGLTHKQRALVISIIVLLCYLTFGSLAQTFMLKTSFIDALYFTVVSIETIGFGDIYPHSTATRIFMGLYVSWGMLNLALAVALTREALLEAAAASFRERVKELRARQRKRHIKVRWRAAVEWRLRAKNLPLWIADDRSSDVYRHHRSNWWSSAKQACSLWCRKLSLVSEDRPCYAPSDKHLNLNALTEAQLEAAALEAGAPLADLLPSRLETPPIDTENADIQSQPIAQPQPLLTHMRIGGMISLLGQFAVAVTHSQANADMDNVTNHDDIENSIHDDKTVREKLGVPFTRTLTIQDEESFIEILKAEEKIASIARLTIACFLFLVFWAAGSAIFMTTEGWEWGMAVYFCFIAFTTVGYGDLAPKTQAGRSIFVVWALLGVATMTILISILTEAYSKSYQSAIKAEMIKAGNDAGVAFTRYRSIDSGTAVYTGMEQFSSYLLPSSPSQFRSATLPPSRNDFQCTSKIPSVQMTRKVKYDTRKRTLEGMTAISLNVLRRAEKLQSLVSSAEESEILEIVSLLFLKSDLTFSSTDCHRKRMSIKLNERFKILLPLLKVALSLPRWYKL